MSDWKNLPEDCCKILGFVYEIKNLVTGKMYIGQTKTVDIVKRKYTKKQKVEDPSIGRKSVYYMLYERDWKNYWGSSGKLKEDIETYGEEQFQRTVLKVCYSKAELRYWETQIQFERNVFILDIYYNEEANIRLGGPGLTPVKDNIKAKVYIESLEVRRRY